MKILLVEDEPFIAFDLEQLVQSAGHQVVGVAETREQALRLADAERPDAALIDVSLKDGLSGPGICRTLCEEHGIRAVFVTGNREHVPADRAGALAVFEKPFSDKDVATALRLLSTAQKT
jgi:DNA-binding response OmpR family regulator